MRQVSLFSLLILCLGCNSSKHTTVKPALLNGVWVPIRQEIGGKSLPAAAFEKQKLIIDNKMYTVVAESVDKGEVNVDGN